MIIGITGRSGAGKSYLSEILAKELDLVHIEIDKISHEVLSLDDSKQFLLKEFGTEIFDNGVLNRKLLGKIVFANQEKLDKLNKFCQIEMEKKIDKIIANSTKSIILDYALLCGLKQFKNCDVKILLNADLDTRYSRAKMRENFSKEYFISRDNTLSDFNEKDFDYVYNHITESEISLLIEHLKSKI